MFARAGEANKTADFQIPASGDRTVQIVDSKPARLQSKRVALDTTDRVFGVINRFRDQPGTRFKGVRIEIGEGENTVTVRFQDTEVTAAIIEGVKSNSLRDVLKGPTPRSTLPLPTVSPSDTGFALKEFAKLAGIELKPGDINQEEGMAEAAGNTPITQGACARRNTLVFGVPATSIRITSRSSFQRPACAGARFSSANALGFAGGRQRQRGDRRVLLDRPRWTAIRAEVQRAFNARLPCMASNLARGRSVTTRWIAYSARELCVLAWAIEADGDGENSGGCATGWRCARKNAGGCLA
ncbi:MAG: DUF3780 domain-containing protein [Dechloromonas sp.]|uniref:DUF3780 domain-containing protein n=1 Tax=Candidatus Dechloromonas phosphorivorans TaxID=2899244 RepID=A0A935N1Q5_9RHOO|nr:DUF3780 domain-containing protein [Candidatus Dechloromonas phosphorivorans]